MSMYRHYEDQGAYLERKEQEKKQERLREKRWNKIDTIDAKLHSVYMRLDNIENNLKDLSNKLDAHLKYCKEVDEELDIKLQELLNRTTAEKVKGWFFN